MRKVPWQVQILQGSTTRETVVSNCSFKFCPFPARQFIMTVQQSPAITFITLQHHVDILHVSQVRCKRQTLLALRLLCYGREILLCGLCPIRFRKPLVMPLFPWNWVRYVLQAVKDVCRQLGWLTHAARETSALLHLEHVFALNTTVSQEFLQCRLGFQCTLGDTLARTECGVH